MSCLHAGESALPNLGEVTVGKARRTGKPAAEDQKQLAYSSAEGSMAAPEVSGSEPPSGNGAVAVESMDGVSSYQPGMQVSTPGHDYICSAMMLCKLTPMRCRMPLPMAQSWQPQQSLHSRRMASPDLSTGAASARNVNSSILLFDTRGFLQAKTLQHETEQDRGLLGVSPLAGLWGGGGWGGVVDMQADRMHSRVTTLQGKAASNSSTSIALACDWPQGECGPS